jgi:hypothetical protein
LASILIIKTNFGVFAGNEKPEIGFYLVLVPRIDIFNNHKGTKEICGA